MLYDLLFILVVFLALGCLFIVSTLLLCLLSSSFREQMKKEFF